MADASVTQTWEHHPADLTEALDQFEARLDAAFGKLWANLIELMNRVPPAALPRVRQQTLNEKRQVRPPKGIPTALNTHLATLRLPGPRVTWGIPPKHRPRMQEGTTSRSQRGTAPGNFPAGNNLDSKKTQVRGNKVQALEQARGLGTWLAAGDIARMESANFMTLRDGCRPRSAPRQGL
ncbi:Hypothetical predicted protein [Pelobates cultripes]|uniref:Uncharacterized protein n=1 Tax=Pelobates cultripes TaxID=61616 RepID=A0AAD1TBF1_PELCU|nr:Hypothetical predicted protein [Pelobates cultripes]CAH2328959.1 Hypothetical predicted protein [Pelobates cultripes]